MRWPKYWNFSFNISPSNEYPGLISFRMDWLDLLAVQETLKSLLQDPYICCLQDTHFRSQDTYRLKVRGWKNISHANGKQKKAGVAILISDRIDLKIMKTIRDREGHYIMIKGSIQEEDITIGNIYAPNIEALQYIRQILTDIKGEIDSNTIMVGDLNTSLTPMGRSSKYKINKEIKS